MAKNDVLLLDGIIDERVESKTPSNKRDEAFEFLAFEQLLKTYDLSSEELDFGSVDGRDDGGIDGFFIFINGHLLIDLESFIWPKSGALLEVWIITCKHHDTFKQPPLDSLVASLSELFDLGLSAESFQGDYSGDVIKLRENLKYAYRKLSPRLSNFKINIAYASRGDTGQIGDSIKSRSEQIESLTKESFGACDIEFLFVGASELVSLHRKIPSFSLELPFTEVFSSGERYVLLANLSDYYRFVSDEGKLRRYLFDSNVRDFMGLNRVNEDIKNTLENDNSPDFWCLNNGVTILVTSASVVGEIIKLEDIQIVNGLQTTESIYRYFEAGGADEKNRSVLIKIIVSQDNDVRDEIIRATNNQTDVEMASLHATDKIQRDIEDIFERSDYLYERRKNYHANMGNPSSKIVTPLYLASGYVSLILKSPQRASTLKSKFMRSDGSYNLVFSERTPLSVYPVIADILKKTDLLLEMHRITPRGGGERFLKRWRYLVSFITVSRLIGTFGFSAKDLVNFDLTSYTDIKMKETWDFICEKSFDDLGTGYARKQRHYVDLCREAANEFSINDIDRVESWVGFGGSNQMKKTEKKREKPVVDFNFAMKVHDILPPQPWKPGMHISIMRRLKCSKNEYFKAVEILIKEGLRHKQKDGVVYDEQGNVVMFDPDRVSPNTLELLADDTLEK